jgi:replicative DNA helicase
MAAIEWRVVSELLRSKDMLSVQRLGFNMDHLSGEPEAAQIFDYVRKWYHDPDTFREFPTMASIKRRWPSFQMTGKSDAGTLRTLMQDCKGLALEADVRSLASYFQELVDDDPQKAIEIMQSHLSRLAYLNQPATGFSIQEIVESVEDQYLGAQSGAIYGIPWAWECLTADTLGKNPEDFIVIYARMKSMKTWILLINAMLDYLVHRRRVLVWSREMSRKKTALRCGSILGRVDYQCLKNGTLPVPLYKQAMMGMKAMAAKWDKSRKALEEIRKGTYEIKNIPDLLIVSGRGAPRDLETMDAIVEAFNPDIVYLDSMYHLDTAAGKLSRSEPERQRHLSVNVKQRAIDWGLPIVATVQGNRDAEKTYGDTLSDIGWTDSLGQEADYIMRVLYKKGPDLHEDEYEGYWDALAKKVRAPENGAPKQRSGRMRLGMSAAAKKKFGRSLDGVPRKVQAKLVDRIPTEPRKSAELFLMAGGNREGVLEGFSIRCVPGYIWDVTRPNITPKEVKDIFDPPKKGDGKGKGRREEKYIDPVKNAGQSFSGMSDEEAEG